MARSKITIIDYDSGNLRSVFNAILSIKTEDQEVLISSNPVDLQSSTHIILPGVGSYKDCMKGLKSKPGMIGEIRKQVIAGKKPFLGICVGMQLLSDIGFEDGETKGLGFISGEVKKMSNDEGSLKIPHIGWNNLELKKEHPILNDINEGEHAYFVHSYCFEVKNKDCVLAEASYGSNKISAIISSQNIIATQFHPEKSAKAGLTLLKNFINS